MQNEKRQKEREQQRIASERLQKQYESNASAYHNNGYKPSWDKPEFLKQK